jgi:site-specific recombinase XerD
MGLHETPKNTEATVARFIEHLRKNKMSDHTIRAYASDVNGFLRQYAGGSNSSDLGRIIAMQTKDIEDYLCNLARTGSRFASVRRTSCALKNFFIFLVDQGVTKNNPAAALRVTPLQSCILSSDQIVSVFRHLNRRQASTESGDSIRSQRDELILFLMIFYGVRQYQICTLKLSSFQTSGKSVSLIVSTLFTLRLHAQVLRKLRAYLESRNSSSDTIFLESLGKKPLDYWGIRHALNDLSQALRFDCSPRSLHNTYLYLSQHQEVREPLIKRILSNGFSHNYDAVPNA